MKAIALVACAVFLLGCENPNRFYYDQDVRREVFLQCLTSVPKGPEVTKYNDWAEVVDQCGTEAGYIAARGSTARAKPAAGATAP